MKVVYPALLLQYMMKSDDVPLKAKLILSAALGYFILPIDFIPDFAPLLGFTDALGVLLLIIRQIDWHQIGRVLGKVVGRPGLQCPVHAICFGPAWRNRGHH